MTWTFLWWFLGGAFAAGLPLCLLIWLMATTIPPNIFR
jgi:hypothetical protein